MVLLSGEVLYNHVAEIQMANSSHWAIVCIILALVLPDGGLWVLEI